MRRKECFKFQTFRERRGMRGARAREWRGPVCVQLHGRGVRAAAGTEPAPPQAGACKGQSLYFGKRKKCISDAHTLPAWRVIMMLQG